MYHFLGQVLAKYTIVTSDFKTVEKKFLDQGIEKTKVKDYLAKFKDLRDKNKLSGDEKNIDLWSKKSFEDFRSFVDKLSKVKTKTEVKKEARVEGAKLIAENEGWKVYEITSHKAAMLYGSNTKWCITEADSQHYQEYSKKNNIYYLISKNLDPRENSWAKIALLVDIEGKKTYWDAKDIMHLRVPDELNIPNFRVEKAVYSITVNGNKYDVLNLPENLEVIGDLDLENTPISSLPAGLRVKGNLILQGAKITSLPAGLKVDGNLDLASSEITSLPEGLTVGRELDLSETKITSLPRGVTIKGNLILDRSAIKSLPEGLTVGGDLRLYETPITLLPAELTVVGDLYLNDSGITSLPPGLTVYWNLDLRETKITSLPDDLIVRKIYVDDAEKIKCSDELRRKLK